MCALAEQINCTLFFGGLNVCIRDETRHCYTLNQFQIFCENDQNQRL